MWVFIYDMSKAFILLNCDLGTEDETIKELLTIAGISFAYKTRGVYDIVVKLNLGSEDELRSTAQKIRRINNVRSSLTMLVAEG